MTTAITSRQNDAGSRAPTVSLLENLVLVVVLVLESKDLYYTIAWDLASVVFYSLLNKPKGPMITGTVVVFIPHVFSISISRSLYFESFSAVFKEVFRTVGIDISMSIQVLSFLSFTTMSGLFAFISLLVWIGMSQSIVAVWFSVTVAGSCS